MKPVTSDGFVFYEDGSSHLGWIESGPALIERFKQEIFRDCSSCLGIGARLLLKWF